MLGLRGSQATTNQKALEQQSIGQAAEANTVQTARDAPAAATAVATHPRFGLRAPNGGLHLLVVFLEEGVKPLNAGRGVPGAGFSVAEASARV
jgi:hypothetical protein